MSIAAKDLLRFLCVSAAIMLMAAALNFAVDPLQLFRPARLPAMYSQDSRMQNAGLIRSQDFDTAFMGTSLAIHFRQSDIDRLLGVNSLKLAMTGSNSHEQSFVIAAALARHAKRVIWQVDDWIFADAPDIDQDVYFPVDLYRRNTKGIAGYLLSGAMARKSAWMLTRSNRADRANHHTADHRRPVQIRNSPRRRHQHPQAQCRPGRGVQRQEGGCRLQIHHRSGAPHLPGEGV